MKACLASLSVAAIAMMSMSSPSVAAETFTIWARSATANVISPLVRAYNDTHKTQARLNIVPGEQMMAKYATASVAGSTPDAIVLDLIYAPVLASAGKLEDVSDYAKGLPYYSALSPAHFKVASYGGKIYAMPFLAESSILLYNKDLFRKAGLDPETPPKTWSEIRTFAEKIAAIGPEYKGFYLAGRCGGCNAFASVGPYVWASGGEFMSEDGLKATLDTPQMRDTLTFLHDLWKDGLIPSSAQADNGADFINAFAGGKIGMNGSGAFAVGFLTTKFPKLDFGVAPLPGKEGGSSSFSGGDVIGISKGSKHVEAVKEFIEWAYSPDVQGKVLAKNGSLPVRTDIADQALEGLDPRLKLPAKVFATGRTPYTFAFDGLFTSQTGPWITMVNKAVFDGDLDNALKTAQAEFDRMIAQTAPK